MNNQPNYLKLAQFLSMGVALSLLTTIAGINIFVLLLLPLGLWGWIHFQVESSDKKNVVIFFCLITGLCVVDVASNVNAGHALLPSLRIMLSDLRTFGFVVLLWPLFALANISRRVFWTLVTVVVAFSLADLTLVLMGSAGKDVYLIPSSGANVNGQVLVGIFYLLAQILLTKPDLWWRIAAAMCILLAGLFLASQRRTGWILLLAGGVFWTILNRERLISKGYQKWLVLAVLIVGGLMFSSKTVHGRFNVAWQNIQLYVSQTTAERVVTPTAVGVRMQYVDSSIQLIKEGGWLGVGTLNFRDAFWRANGSVEGMQGKYSNPHNEYLYMLATKGSLGLILYLAIFAQACRIAMQKKDEVQRVGMLMLVFLFMLSITANSMMTDMKEGHFAMLMLLVFLAPRELNLLGKDNHS